MKTIIIDARLAGVEHGGIGRYVQSLIERLEDQQSKSSDQNFEIKTISPDIKHYSLEEQLLMPKVLKNKHPDLVHFPHFNVPLFYNGPFVVTIHDLLWHERIGFGATTQPKVLYLVKYVAYRLVMRHAIFRSKAIISPSVWVKDRLIERFPSIGPKVHVIAEGVSRAFQASNADAADTLGRMDLLLHQYLISVGSLYPHKNVRILLDILPEFPQLKLVVVCGRSVFWARFAVEVKKRGLSSQVYLAGFVPDEELATLYRKALAFVFPSTSEGFGLPGLEAMACGCPVISSTAGALPEVYGEAAIYFDPHDKKGLVENIRKLQTDENLRKDLMRKGLIRSRKFSWQRCVTETQQVYAEELGLE